MAEKITEKEARELRQALNSWLTVDLGLDLNFHFDGLLTDSQKSFAAFLALQRSQVKGNRVVDIECPVVARFPEYLHGSLAELPESVILANVLDENGDSLDEHKVWQVILILWLGAGGHRGLPWEAISKCKSFVQYDGKNEAQPYEIIMWVMRQLQFHDNQLMQVFGGDGLDKKQRMNGHHKNFLQLQKWHSAVPALTSAIWKNGAKFLCAMKSVFGMGELFQKEACLALCALKHKSLQRLGESVLVFGPGARNGALTFLGVEADHLKRVGKLLPTLARFMQRVFKHKQPLRIGDVEMCSCFAINYARMVRRIQSVLKGIPFKDADEGLRAAAMRALVSRTPPAFVPFQNGKPLLKKPASLERASFEQFKLQQKPLESVLQCRVLLARHWGFEKLAQSWECSNDKRKRCKQAKKDKELKSALMLQAHPKGTHVKVVPKSVPSASQITSVRESETEPHETCAVALEASSNSAPAALVSPSPMSSSSDGSFSSELAVSCGKSVVENSAQEFVSKSPPTQQSDQRTQPSGQTLAVPGCTLDLTDSCGKRKFEDSAKEIAVQASEAEQVNRRTQPSEQALAVQGSAIVDLHSPKRQRLDRAVETLEDAVTQHAPEWQKQESRSRPGVHYYYNRISGESVAEPPRRWVRKESRSVPGYFCYVDLSTWEQIAEPPHPWQKIASRNNPEVQYYWNPDSDKTSIVKPEL